MEPNDNNLNPQSESTPEPIMSNSSNQEASPPTPSNPSFGAPFQSPKPKHKKPVSTIVLACTTAIFAGLAVFFGYQYLTSGQSNNSQPNNTNETTQPAASSENTETDTPSTKYVFSEDDAPGLDNNTSMAVSSVMNTGIKFLLQLDGSVSAEYQWVEWNSYGPEIETQRRDADVLTDYIDGHVVDISTGHIGNGGFGEVFFLLDDGTVTYMNEGNILSKNYDVKKLIGAENIVRIYGNLHNIDYAGFVQDFSGKISPIILDKIDGNNVTLRVD